MNIENVRSRTHPSNIGYLDNMYMPPQFHIYYTLHLLILTFYTSFIVTYYINSLVEPNDVMYHKSEQ